MKKTTSFIETLFLDTKNNKELNIIRTILIISVMLYCIGAIVGKAVSYFTH
ncbi:hypothetical protein [Flavobacterium hercynium]|uniref:hypothetical protein n=1 Tax=Flavobacterium hercynium TaxID=387094 RepID=UPI0013FD41A7|nr:hypothetical protein [Flavobacterium hercynium]SMP09631.1 hypothetical protein SAMN06265346_102317 [Flavobacterium hercynium]